MMQKLVRTIVLATFCLWLSSCVTTTNSRYDDKKDLEKAVITYVQIGYGYFEQGNLFESKKALTKALDIDPKAAGAHMGLARVYDRELEHKLADDHFKKALRYGESTEGHFQYGVYLYNQGNFKGAYSQLNKTLEDTVYGRRSLAFEYQGVIASRLGKTDEAISNYERALALNAGMYNSHLGLTNIYFERKDFPTAYHHYNGFVRLVRAQAARHSATSLWLGIQLAGFAEDKDAISSLSLQLRNQYPDSNEYQYYLDWKEKKDAV